MDDAAPTGPGLEPEVAGQPLAAAHDEGAMSAVIRQAVTEYLDQHYPVDDTASSRARRHSPKASGADPRRP